MIRIGARGAGNQVLGAQMCTCPVIRFPLPERNRAALKGRGAKFNCVGYMDWTREPQIEILNFEFSYTGL